ncbi:Proton-coupled amino acid transporter 4 [Trachymyrmex cornetzi]|uniref:Proton-coupled amino acid transporter 4 n=1 Tax=Trachymyrmex cornetzi TaxID=471704 RepID=A0A195E4Y6_9HYME|nr:Proton-coupled amino acid transporter 4 [Trachymyrmex cornetzi]
MTFELFGVESKDDKLMHDSFSLRLKSNYKRFFPRGSCTTGYCNRINSIVTTKAVGRSFPGSYSGTHRCPVISRLIVKRLTSIGPRRQATPEQCRESECAVIKLFRNMSPMGVPDRSDSKTARVRQKNRPLPFDSINNNECAQRYPATCCAAFPRTGTEKERKGGNKQEVEGQPSESTTQQEAYDPHLNRITYRPVSDFGSLANLIKSAAGTGLFAMPNAFACVGLFIGIVGTAFMGLLITGSLQLLVRIHHMMCVRLRKPILVYDEVVVATLTTDVRKPWLSPRAATLIIDIIMLACYIGIGSVYVVFISGIIQECIDTEKVIGQSYYALMIFPLLFVMNMAKNLADIAPISIVGNILLFAAGLIGIVYALKDGIGDEWTTIGPNIDLYPKFIGVVFFSMCSPGVILAIEHSMKKPWNYVKMCGILNWGMAFLVIIHIFVGSIGYVKWGPTALGNFIRNHETLDGPTLAALIMQALAIYFTYGLQCYMPISILNYGYAIPAIEDGILAAAIPKLDLFTGLVGGICISTLATLIPGLKPERRIGRLRRVKPHRDPRKGYISYYMCDYGESLKIGSPYSVRVTIRRFGFPLREKFREDSQRELNTAVAESTSEEAIGESAECSKIHELSDRVRLSGVCSVKLALAHRIASDRATAATTAAAATVPRDEVLLMGSTINIKSNGFCRKIHSATFRAAAEGGVASSEEIRKFGKSFGFRFTAWIRLSARHFSDDESTTLVQELLLRIRDDTTKPKDRNARGGDGTAK